MADMMYVVDDYNNGRIYASETLERLKWEVPPKLWGVAEPLLLGMREYQTITLQDTDKGIDVLCTTMTYEKLTDYMVERDCVHTVTGA